MHLLNWQKASLISMAAIALSAATVVAQQRPGYGTQGGQRQGQPPMQQTQQPFQPLPPVPPVDTTPLTEANTAVTKAKADLKKSQGVLFGAAKRFDKTIDAKPDVQAATTQLSASQASLQSLTGAVMAKLKTDAAYKAATVKATTAKEAVTAVRGNADATMEQRLAAAQDALKANEAVSKIEADAMSADPKVAAAKAKVTADNDVVQKLRIQYRAGMKDDAEWAAANKDVADKQAKVDAADKQLADARKIVADRQASHAQAVAARNKQEQENAARNGGYGMPAGIPSGATPGR